MNLSNRTADNNSFYEMLFSEVHQNRDNYYTDNLDIYRFGRPTFKTKLKAAIKKMVGTVFVRYKTNYPLNFPLPYLARLNRLYNLLEDDYSKNLLVSLVTYEVLGHERYKLPLAKTFWQGIADMEKSLKPKGEALKIKFVNNINIFFHQYDLSPVGFPVNLYTTPIGAYYNCTVDQYTYNQGQTTIKVESGDTVLDCGACWGDTAVMFAAAGATVYSFEFIPSNIEVFAKNVELNPHLKDRINLVPQPLGESSGKELFYIDNGPASRVSTTNIQGSQAVKLINIDDFCSQNKIEKIDFIKMDIEGAELPALKGAVNVIKKFKPKLAISIYHSMNDFVEIAAYLDSLNLGYRFYLNHGTIHREETVLMAQV